MNPRRARHEILLSDEAALLNEIITCEHEARRDCRVTARGRFSVDYSDCSRMQR